MNIKTTARLKLNIRFKCITFFLIIFCANFFSLQSNPTYVTDSDKYHIVQKGDTLYGISRKYKIPVDKLRTFNNMKSDNIFIGQKVYLSPNLPQKQDYVSQRPIPAEKYHRVQKGETLYRISKMYGVEIIDLLDFNDLETFQIQVNQKIWLEDRGERDSRIEKPESPKKPKVKPQVKSTKPSETYTVRKGDTLYGISRKFNLSLTELKKLNNIQTNQIKVGQKLLVYSNNIKQINKPTNVVDNQAKKNIKNIPANPAETLFTPVKGKVISKFGIRNSKPHKGIDIAASMGEPIHAARKGKVVYSGVQRGYGNVIVLEHENYVMTVYAHNESNLVRLGEIVKEGQPIATVGQSGNAAGPHLHFEYRVKGKAMDPLTMIKDL